jgi:hypothetical protein
LIDFEKHRATWLVEVCPPEGLSEVIEVAVGEIRVGAAYESRIIADRKDRDGLTGPVSDDDQSRDAGRNLLLQSAGRRTHPGNIARHAGNQSGN